MAISRGAGTEILRQGLFQEIDATTTIIINGEQHHIYTVLIVNICCNGLQAVTNKFKMFVQGYDSKAGDDGVAHNLMYQLIPSNSTFVWDDKFSFYGSHPTDFGSPPLSTAAEQDALADMGRSLTQGLYCLSDHASDNFDVAVAYIDQNNS